MPLDTPPLLERERKFAFDLETTTGTQLALTAADAVTPVYDPVIEPDIERDDRPPLETLSHSGTRSGARGARVTFSHELYGKGATGAIPTWANILLKSCGMQVSSTTFRPISGAVDTTTFQLAYPGYNRYAYGCMGSWTLLAERAKVGRMSYNYQGVYGVANGDALASPTYDSVTPPRVGAITFTIGGVATYRVPRVEIDFGNTVIYREDITAKDEEDYATGYRAAYITNRRCVVRIEPEALPLSAQDWETIERAETTVALSLVIGDDLFNTITIAAPKMQLVTNPGFTSREGMLAQALEFLCLANSAAGDDELTIAF